MALPEAQIGEKEKIPLEERPTIPEIPPGVERVEAIAGAEITLPKPITDSSGQPILDNAAPQQVTITLPLTEEEMQQALHLKIIYSLRWLAEWVKRLTKIIRGNFLYRFK
jgi:sugar (pentulose or hexulose) kinase